MRNINDHKLEPLGRYGPNYRVMTVEEFRSEVPNLPANGKGWYGTASLEGDDEVDLANINPPGRLTHVIWYNLWPTGYVFPVK